MSTETSWTRVRPDTPFSADIQPELPFASPHPCHQPDPLFPLSTLHTSTATLPIHFQIITDSDDNADSSVPPSGKDEEEHTLSGYGDIPLSDVILPPLPSSASPGASPSSLQLRFPQSRPRLRFRRPMPRRRISIQDTLPFTKGLDSDDPSPGSPRFVPNSRHQHQPLVSPHHITPPGSQMSNENMPADNNGSSVERLVDELLPDSPSIRLSPPGSPRLSRESHDQNDDAQKLPSSPLAPASAPQENKPKPAPWRTRLPPRPPLPKWDI